MKRLIMFFSMLSIGMFLIVGMVACDDPSQPTASSPSTTSSQATQVAINATQAAGPTPTHIAINTKNEIILTMADNNRQIKVKPGTTIEVKLDDKSNSWLVSSTRTDVLIPWANAPMPAHIQAIYNAGSTGSAQITASGQSSCASKASSCAPMAQTFQVQISVN